MSFDKSLERYIVVKDSLSQELCGQVLSELDQANWDNHQWGGSQGLIDLENDKEFSVCWDDLKSDPQVMDHIWHAIHAYITDLDSPLFDGWAGFTKVRYNRYDTGTKMLPHVDHIKTAFDGERKGVPILSVVGLLNDDYTGGEFVMWDDTVVELKQGDIMIFPSNFLYPHHVAEVTEGTRNTFVAWVW